VKKYLPIIVACSISLAYCGGCSHVNKQLGLKDDHYAEEIGEWVIEEYTGLEGDLTPDSPED
jgi:hypothetical protein